MYETAAQFSHREGYTAEAESDYRDGLIECECGDKYNPEYGPCSCEDEAYDYLKVALCGEMGYYY